MSDDIVLGSGSVTKIEKAVPTQVKEIMGYGGEKKTKIIPIKGAFPEISSTITLDKQLNLSKDNMSITFNNRTLEFGKHYEIVLREKDMTEAPGRAFREEEQEDDIPF